MKKKEYIIARTDSLENGKMKMIKTDDGLEVLLLRVNDRFYATDPHCAHYGAPLEKGMISEDRIICPWHHAQFRLTTGELLEPPAMHGLKQYRVEVRGENVVLIAEEDEKTAGPAAGKSKSSGESGPVFMIIGGGTAGHAAARILRERGFEGIIRIISADSRAPYDRTNLSKDFLRGDMDPEWLPLNPAEFYDENEIDLLLNTKVTAVNTKNHEVTLENTQTMKYNKLLIASGGLPKGLSVPGSDLNNIFKLRSADDAEKIMNAAGKTKNLVIIGAGFIGLESAENLNDGRKQIQIIAPEAQPLEKILGHKVSRLIRENMETRGIRFHMNAGVAKFIGNGKLESVELKDGSRIDADMAIVAIGITPVTDFLSGSLKTPDGGIKVDAYLQAAEDVFAAGDIAVFPYWKTGKPIRVEHWRIAQQLGGIAAANMLGKKIPVRVVPFFWTILADMNFRYIGYSDNWDDTFIQGDIGTGDFIVCYIRENRVQAALGLNRDKDLIVIEELMKADRMPDASALMKMGQDLTGLSDYL